MQTACQGEGTGEPDDPSSLHQEPARPATQDCSSFDIVRATQVISTAELMSHLQTVLNLYEKKMEIVFVELHKTNKLEKTRNLRCFNVNLMRFKKQVLKFV